MPGLHSNIMKSRLALLGLGLLLLAGAPARAPEFSLETTAGARVSLADFSGKIVFLAFFQDGCRPCELEVPVLNRLSRQYLNELQVLGIGYQSADKEKLKKTALRMKLEYPALLDDQNLAGKLGLFGLPFGALVDEYGYLVQRYYGFRPEELEKDIREQIERLRAKPPGRRMALAPVSSATEAAKAQHLDQQLFKLLAEGLKRRGFTVVGPEEPAEWVVEGSVSMAGKIAGVSIAVKQKATGNVVKKVEKTVAGGDFSGAVEEVCQQAAQLP